MSTKLSHPYKDHPEPWQWPKEHQEGIEELYEWWVPSEHSFRLIPKFLLLSRVIKQPRFPKMSKNHVHQFYHACIYDKEETKKAFNRYVEVRSWLINQCWQQTEMIRLIFQLRASSPECFGVRDPFLPEIQHIYNITWESSSDALRLAFNYLFSLRYAATWLHCQTSP